MSLGLMAMLMIGVTSTSAFTDEIDPVRLDAATVRAEQRWEELGVPAKSHAFDTATLESDQGIISLIAGNLDGRREHVLQYVNDALLPSMHARRSNYVCFMTKEFYNSTVPTDELTTFQMPGLSFILDLVWFIMPTTEELKKQDLQLGSEAAKFESAARTDPENWHFGIWKKDAVVNLPCEAELSS